MLYCVEGQANDKPINNYNALESVVCGNAPGEDLSSLHNSRAFLFSEKGTIMKKFKFKIVDRMEIDEESEDTKEAAVGKNKKKKPVKEKAKPKWTEVCAKAMKDNDAYPPLFTKLAKGMDKKKITFSIYLRHHEELMSIKEKYPNRYKTDSDIYRQFAYNMIELHLEVTKDVPLEKAIDDGLSKSLRTATRLIEQRYNRYMKRLLVIEAIKMMQKEVKEEDMSHEEFDKKSRALIEELPLDLQKKSREDFKRLKAGDKVTDINDFFEKWGSG